jgi:hypothetical protein
MYTNDAKTLGQQLSRDVSNPSAIQQQDEAQKMGPQPDRGPQVDISQGMGMSLA